MRIQFNVWGRRREPKPKEIHLIRLKLLWWYRFLNFPYRNLSLLLCIDLYNVATAACVCCHSKIRSCVCVRDCECERFLMRSRNSFSQSANWWSSQWFTYRLLSIDLHARCAKEQRNRLIVGRIFGSEIHLYFAYRHIFIDVNRLSTVCQSNKIYIENFPTHTSVARAHTMRTFLVLMDFYARRHYQVVLSSRHQSDLFLHWVLVSQHTRSFWQTFFRRRRHRVHLDLRALNGKPSIVTSAFHITNSAQINKDLSG